MSTPSFYTRLFVVWSIVKNFYVLAGRVEEAFYQLPALPCSLLLLCDCEKSKRQEEQVQKIKEEN